MEIDKLLALGTKNKSTYIHLKPGQKPIARINNKLYEVGNVNLAGSDIQKLVYEIMSEEQIKNYQECKLTEFSYMLQGSGRYRITVYRDRGEVAATIKHLGTSTISLPDEIKNFLDYKWGIILICGSAGSGKTAFATSLLEEFNSEKRHRVITLEDPIEYIFKDKQSLFTQLEMGRDISSFDQAIRLINKSDAELVYLSDIADSTSLEFAFKVSGSGRLLVTTFNCSTAAAAITQLLELEPSERKGFCRSELARNLRVVMALKLLPSATTEVEPVLATEMLTVSNSVAGNIANNEVSKLADIMAASKDPMIYDFTQSYLELIRTKRITKKTALENSPYPDRLKMSLQGIAFDSQGIVTT